MVAASLGNARAAVPQLPALPARTLVLGGARSGKSAFAERLCVASGRAPVYLATAEARDGEMAARIAAHRLRRGPAWLAIEAPLALTDALERAARADTVVLVDCLTLWLSNLMEVGRDVEAEHDRLFATLARLRGPVVLVSNEVGLGIVPDNPLARRFRDAAGRLNQAIAEAAERVVFVAAGLPLVLKGNPL
jgi:adenosylcobinamide kinase/adenosylcobinamide-phosphate guanylyltransferase